MLENKEIWRDIKGYPNYQISNMGRIWSKNRQAYMKPQRDPCGYQRVRLIAINGKAKTEKVHRLVAITFIDNPNSYPEVDHINRNREDNRAANLRWVSHKENGRNTIQNRKVYQYTKNGILIGEYNSVVEAAEKNNIAPTTLYMYFQRKGRYCSGFVWSYNKFFN